MLIPFLDFVFQTEPDMTAGGWFLSWYDQTAGVFASSQNLGNPGNVGGNDRKAAGHGLQGSDRKALIPRRQNIEVGRREIASDQRPIVQEAVDPQDAGVGKRA